MGDLDLVGGQVATLGDGRPITVGHMKGRSRAYTLTARSPLGKTAISAAFNDRCDMVVATVVVLPHDRPHATEPKVIEFLKWQDRDALGRGHARIMTLIFASTKSAVGQSRRLSKVGGMSASPPTPDISLRRSESTLWAMSGHAVAQEDARSDGHQ